MADKHMHRLQQICSGKKQCHFNAPVHRYINYDINYCFVLYRCINGKSENFIFHLSNGKTSFESQQMPLDDELNGHVTFGLTMTIQS